MDYKNSPWQAAYKATAYDQLDAAIQRMLVANIMENGNTEAFNAIREIQEISLRVTLAAIHSTPAY